MGARGFLDSLGSAARNRLLWLPGLEPTLSSVVANTANYGAGTNVPGRRRGSRHAKGR